MPNKNDSVGALPWILLGLAGGVGLYWLLKPRSGSTQAAPVAPLTPPERFADLDSVDARFGQVRELYRMGYLDLSGAMGELTSLSSAARALESQDPEKAGLIMARIENYQREIQPASVAMRGRYRIVN